jgi:hypothetical protein
MVNSYSNSSVQFLFPEGWNVDENRTGEGLTVSLQSPYSMFVFVNCYDKPMDAEEVADQALETMQQEYDDLDSEEIRETIANCPAVGHDVNFFSLDLTNTCWIRALTWNKQTVLVFAQTNDLDLERAELAFRGICASLKLGTPNPS